MNFSRLPSSLALGLGAASVALTLTACGSDAESPSATSSSTSSVAEATTSPATTETAPATSAEAMSCPTPAPAGGAAPEWTLPGATGSVAVTGSTDAAAPVIDVEAPFSVTETQVKTLQPGEGPVVSESATVLVCYLGVNGRDGSVFDSSYERGTPVDFPLGGVVPGFQKAIAGQNVGSTVAVAMVPEDGYPEGQPAAGIQPGDSLIFAIKILDAMN